MKKQLKNITIYILFFLSLFSGAMNLAHAEDGRLQITVDEGMKGKAKREKGFPITLTVKNNGDDFSGDLTITIPRDHNSIGNKVIPIDIASGASKKIHFSVSGMEGMSLLQNRPGQQTVKQFHLYEGSWEDGKEVPIDTGLAINPAYINNTKKVIGVLTDQPDELNYLKLLTFAGDSPEVLFLDQEDIPEQSIGLGVLDMLVVQDYTVANLSEERQKAIGEWLKKGGHLVAGSSPGMEQQFDTLYGYLPYSIEGRQTVDSLEALNQMGSLNVSDFELFQGTVNDGATASFEEQGIPLVIGQQIGQGEVTQFSYDMSQPVFQEWDGNQELWDSFVDPYYPGNNRNINDRLGRASQSFETVANFKLSTLALLFVGYLLLLSCPL